MLPLPYRDDNPSQNFPFVTLGIIIINCIIFFLFGLKENYYQIIKTYGFIPSSFNFFTLISSLFLHADFFHLLGNMWYLWIFGDNVEDKMGKTLFFTFYILGGIFASIIHSIFTPAKDIPTIGASGAISAVMGAYFLFFPWAKIRCFCMLYFYKIIILRIKAYIFLGMWFLLQLFYASFGEFFSVAFFAHIGGFIFGASFAYFIKMLKGGEVFISPQEKREKEREEEIEREEKEIEKKESLQKQEFIYYKNLIEKLLDEKKIKEAIESYIEFEKKALPYTLSPFYQKMIADILFKENNYIFSLQAYLKYISNYPNEKDAIDAKCKLAFIYSKVLKDPSSSLKYLNEVLNCSSLIKDESILKEVIKEKERIENFLKKIDFFGEKYSKYCVVLQIRDEKIVENNKEKIFEELFTIGKYKNINLGVKLAYRFKNTFSKCKGILFEDLDYEEAVIASEKLQSLNIPVVIFPQEEIFKYRKIEEVRKVEIVEKKILFSSLERKVVINPEDVFYCILGEIIYFVYRYEDSSDAIEVADFGKSFDKEEKLDDLKINKIIDIFTNNYQRYRISSYGFSYKKSFEEFIEDLAEILGGDKLDENIRIFISNPKGERRFFKDIQEFNQQALWDAILRRIYLNFK